MSAPLAVAAAASHWRGDFALLAGFRRGADPVAALAVEESFRNDPAYNNRVYKVDVVLAMLAVRADGNSKEARKYLRAAAPIKTDDNWFPATLKLLVLLLRYGNADDRAAVIEFCELHGKVASTPGVDLLQAAQKLRQGVMPTWYQYEVTQFK